jgi:hypothetical protein
LLEKYLTGFNFAWKSKPSLYDKNSFAGWLVVCWVGCILSKCSCRYFGGLAAYQGDLTDKIIPKKVTNGAIGVTVNYELTPQIMLRGGFTYSVIGGADRFAHDDSMLARNLAFETHLTEFSAVGEYYFFNLDEQKFSPYVFGGLAVFHFNPYAYNGTPTRSF